MSALANFDKDTLTTVLNLFSDEQLDSLDDIDKEYVYSLIGKAKDLFVKRDEVEVEEEEELKIGPHTNHPQVVRTVEGQHIGNANMIELYNGLSKEDRIRAKNDAINTVDKGLQDLSGRVLKRIYSQGPIRFWTNLVYTFGKKKYSKRDIPKYLYRPRKYNMQAHIQFHNDFIGARTALTKGHYGTGGLKLMRTWYIKSATNNYLGYFKSLNSAFARTSFVYELIGSYCGFCTMNNISSYATFAKATLSTQTKHLWNEKEKVEKKLKGCGTSDAACTKANFNSCNVNRCLDYLKKELEKLEKKVGKTKKKPGKPPTDVPDIPLDQFNKWKDYLEWAGIALAIILALSMGGAAIGLAKEALNSPVVKYQDYFMIILRFLMPPDDTLKDTDKVKYLGYLPRIKALVDSYTTPEGGMKHSAGRKYNLSLYDQKIGRLEEIGNARHKKLSNRIRGLAYWLRKHTTRLNDESIQTLIRKYNSFGTASATDIVIGNSGRTLSLNGNVCIGSLSLGSYIKKTAQSAYLFGTTAATSVSVGSTSRLTTLNGSSISIGSATSTVTIKGKKLEDWLSQVGTGSTTVVIGNEGSTTNINGAVTINNTSLETYITNLIENTTGDVTIGGDTINLGDENTTVVYKGQTLEQLIQGAAFDATKCTALGTNSSSLALGNVNAITYLVGDPLYINGYSPEQWVINRTNKAYNFGTGVTRDIVLGNTSATTVKGSTINIGDESSEVYIKGKNVEELGGSSGGDDLVFLEMREHVLSHSQFLYLRSGSLEYANVTLKKVAIKCENDAVVQGFGPVINHTGASQYVLYPVNKKITSMSIILGNIPLAECRIRLFLYG